ncbi:MAG: hypothetical protein ACOVLC_11300 [Flavobacterium sp.]
MTTTTEQQIKGKVKILRPKSQAISLFNYNLSDNATRVFKLKDKVGNKISIWCFTNTISIEAPTEIAINLAINIPDNLCMSNIFLKDIEEIGKIYSNKIDVKYGLSCIELISNELKSLKLNKSEGLIVYRNGLQLILSPSREILTEIETLGKIKLVLEKNFPEIESIDDYSDLPSELKQILLENKKFAITDDYERDEIIEGLSKKQRAALIKAIKPKFEQINLFLDAFGEKPLSDGAIGLLSLLELTLELIIKEEKSQSKDK